MSTDHFDSRTALANPATENTQVADLAPGDLIYPPDPPEATSGPDPWRVRHVDRFPGDMVSIHATPGALLQRATSQPLGVWDGATWVKRVVL